MIWSEGTVAKGGTTNHTVNLRAGTSKRTTLVSLVAGSATVDPKLHSNIAVKTIKIN